MKQYLRDEFGRLVYESTPKKELDEKTALMKEMFYEDTDLTYEEKTHNKSRL